MIKKARLSPSRITLMKEMREFCGTYNTREELIQTVIDSGRYNEESIHTDLSHALQYIQVRNKNGVVANWYNNDDHNEIQLTVMMTPDRKYHLMNGVYELQTIESVSVLPFDV